MPEYLIITADDCKWCDKVKDLLESKGHSYATINLTETPEVFRVMQAIGAKTVPQVFKVIGGFEATVGDLG